MTWSVNYRTRFWSAETGWPAADGSIDRLDNRWTSPPRLPFIFQDEFLGNVLRKSFPVEIKEPRSMTINNAVRVALWIKLYRWTLLYSFTHRRSVTHSFDVIMESLVHWFYRTKELTHFVGSWPILKWSNYPHSPFFEVLKVNAISNHLVMCSQNWVAFTPPPLNWSTYPAG